MLKNYFKVALRNLRKNKGFTLINVFGLAMGLATCLLIVFYVFDELSYDRYNVKADRIYRVNNDIKFGGTEGSYAIAPSPAAAALKADFPEIETVTRFRNQGGNQVRKGNQNIQEDRMIYADSTVFKVFTLPMIEGDPASALTAPHSVVITEAIARKYFDRTDVVGQTLLFNDSIPYKITGVIRDIPRQSHFTFDFFLPMTELNESREDAWLSNNFYTYIVLRPGADPKKLEAKFPAFMRAHVGPQLQSVLHQDYSGFEKAGNRYDLSLIPLTKIHLQSNSVYELGPNGSIAYVYIFSAIALFVLLIACVNFMNLSTARSANRAREVGVRKVLGSPRKYLVAQFLTESILVTAVAALIAVFTAWAFLGLFNQLSGKELTITPTVIAWLLPALLLIILVIGCLAGSYPALYLSAFQPIEVLKGKIAAGIKAGMLRSVLVVTQFFISISLIIGTLVIYTQLNYIRHKDLGYDREHVLVVHNLWRIGSSDARTFKDEVKQLSGVENATMSGFLPTFDNNNGASLFKDPVLDQKRALLTQIWAVDEDYITTLGIKMVQGRNFSEDMPTDSTAIIVNEAAAKMLGWANPVGQFLYAPADNMISHLNKKHIIGVMKNFNFKSLRDNVTPMTLYLDQDRGALSIRLRSDDIPSLLSQIRSKWEAVASREQFDYSFMDEDFDGQYRAEQRVGGISVTFTILAIVIACLGLFGLAAYAAEQQTKEIGIRKVLGANVSALVGLLARDFILLVLIAILLAVPLAWWAMHSWLQGFAYRVGISWWLPALAGAGAALIAFITVSFQSIRAALANPIKSLRSE
jgi:putative ABC transport system permease protein